MDELRPDKQQGEYQGRTLPRITVERFDSQPDYTQGEMLVNGEHLCYTMEDEYREVKVKHETRVPEGVYKLGLRDEGGFNKRYSDRYPNMHEGMLCLYNADNWKIICENMNFQYILIHVGNDDEDTSGCILVGDKFVKGSNMITGSRSAYGFIYPIIKDLIKQSPDGYIEIELKDISNGKEG